MGPVRGIGEGADLRQASRQGGDIAFRDVQPRDLARHPVIRYMARHQVQIDGADHAGMFVG